jgi:hypothetical protein
MERTLYTIKSYTEDLAEEVRKRWISSDERHRAIREAKRTSYLLNGDRRKWCDGCGGRSIQEAREEATIDGELRVVDCGDAEFVYEVEAERNVWECTSCRHVTARRVQSDEARQRRADKKEAKRAAELERERAEDRYRNGLDPKPFHLIEKDGLSAKWTLAYSNIDFDPDTIARFKREVAEYEAAKAAQDAQ